MIYLDTNVFMYAADKTSRYYAVCDRLTGMAAHNKIKIVTSAETIQEVIYLFQNRGDLEKGLEMSSYIAEIINEILPVDGSVLQQYLSTIGKHLRQEKISSRDFLHVATCIVYKIDMIITYDADFKKFKEIKTLTPEQFLIAHPPQL